MGGGFISPVDFSGFHDRFVRLITKTGMPKGGGWAYKGVTVCSGGTSAGTVEAQWQQTPTSTLESMVRAFEEGVRQTVASRVARPGWVATAVALAPAASSATSEGPEGSEKGLWSLSDSQLLVAPPPMPGGWQPSAGEQVRFVRWAEAAPSLPVSPPLRLTPSSPRRSFLPPPVTPHRTRRKPGALDATDPDSSAARRRQRNRVSAAKSNERRRQRRLAAVAEAAAAALAAGQGGDSGRSSSGGRVGCEDRSAGDVTSASPTRSVTLSPDGSAVGEHLPGKGDDYRPDSEEGGGADGWPLSSAGEGGGAEAGGGARDATWCTSPSSSG
ncbi:hypothetical protein MMPV_006491 [Pyropia vietnamensis]